MSFCGVMCDFCLTEQKALVIEEEEGGRTMRKHQSVSKFMTELPSQKARKKLTPEEIEERQKKASRTWSYYRLSPTSSLQSVKLMKHFQV